MFIHNIKLVYHLPYLINSHYTVFAVPVSRGTNAARSMPYTPIVPYHQLLSKAISAHLASSVSDKVPFIVGKYEAGLLPDKLVFDGSFRTKDFKADTHYAFVLAAFTKTKVHKIMWTLHLIILLYS